MCPASAVFASMEAKNIRTEPARDTIKYVCVYFRLNTKTNDLFDWH